MDCLGRKFGTNAYLRYSMEFPDFSFLSQLRARQSSSLTHSSLTHSLTHSLFAYSQQLATCCSPEALTCLWRVISWTRTLTTRLTHSHTHSLTHSHTHSLTHSLHSSKHHEASPQPQPLSPLHHYHTTPLPPHSP